MQTYNLQHDTDVVSFGNTPPDKDAHPYLPNPGTATG